MNPETFERAKQIFAEATRRPESKREAFVNEACSNNQAVKDEVLSLLKFHSDKSLMPTMTLDSPSTILETADLPNGGKANSGGSSRRWFPLNRAGSKSDLEDRFSQSTHRLLRKRLVQAIVLIFVMGIVVTGFGMIQGTLSLPSLTVRALVFAMLFTIMCFLRSNRLIGPRQIRLLELATMSAPIIELMMILMRATENLTAEGHPESIPELRAMISAAVAIYIAIYGILIPSRWQRTAIFTLSAAILPIAVVTAHRWGSELAAETDPMHIANTMLTLLMAMVATAGSHFVHQVRLDAEEAWLYGQYRLTDEIGRGGMGVVYRAEHQMLKRPAAIKLIRQEASSDDRTLARFEEEVQISATLSHWNTVQIYDYGRTANDECYYVMEFLDGESLQERLDRQHSLGLQETLAITMQICDGLAEAHDRQMVHRDIKPSNLFLATVGGIPDIVKIVDFGLATMHTTETEGAAQVISGTPQFMSPEQIRGNVVDGRSDIYAIGCVMTECLSGHPPFTAGSISALLSEHLFKTPRLESLDKIDSRIRVIIARCLEKDPKSRFINTKELRTACENILA